MDHLFPVQYSYLIPLLPLLGAVIAGFLGAKWLKQQSHWPIWIGVGCSAILAIWLLFGTIGQASHGGHGEAAAHPAGEHAASAEAHAPVGRFLGADYPVATRYLFTWIDTGNPNLGFHPSDYATSYFLHVAAGFFFDPLTAIMLTVICGIGFFITVFAAGYMKGEEGYFRFFAYLGLFIFAMTILVMGENLILLYLGWEGVGLCSYLLIGYYYDKPAAREAAKKAFLVNRIGDFGFGIGIMLTFVIFGTTSYFGDSQHAGFLLSATNGEFLAQLPEWKRQAVGWIPYLLMVGAFGKSAQFPLYVWLPDAMEGPTPVSALIHAATMVTAGVYMIARNYMLFAMYPAALTTIAVVGAFTAIFAATIALRQFDLKKVFAYSTVSQLGFMFAAVGLLAPVAGVFHLVTHAFFKALLFLSSGVVMHAMAGELDMRKMSGLKRVLPKTRLLMLAGCLALAGMIPFSGFWSKDEIVVAAFERHTAAGTIIGLVLLATAFLTAYYTFRLYFRVFEGPEVIPPAPQGGHGHGHDAHGHSDVDEHLTDQAHSAGHDAHHDHAHNHEPSIMMIPLYVLAVGAVLAGFLNLPVIETLGHFLGKSPSFAGGYHIATIATNGQAQAPFFGQHADEHTIHWLWMFVSIVIAIAGVGLAYLLHLKERYRADELAANMPLVVRLLDAKYYVDEIYQGYIVEPLRTLGRGFFIVDRYVIDGLVWLVGLVPQASGLTLKLAVQRGYLQGYASAMLFGVLAILLIIFL